MSNVTVAGSGTGRRFYLQRDTDVTGVSGPGRIAEGIEFPDGQCVLWWNTSHSLGIYSRIGELRAVHGHDGNTRIIFTDAR